jgi:hypothetical protein
MKNVFLRMLKYFFIASVFFIFGSMKAESSFSILGEWVVSIPGNSDEPRPDCCSLEEHFVFTENGDFHDLGSTDYKFERVQLFQYGKWNIAGTHLEISACAYSDKYERKDERKSTSRIFVITFKDSATILLEQFGSSNKNQFLLKKTNNPFWITKRQMQSMNFFFSGEHVDTITHNRTSIIYSDSAISSDWDGYYIRKYDALWSSSYKLPAPISKFKPDLVVLQSYHDSLKPFSQNGRQIVYTEDVVITYEFTGKDAKKRALRFYDLVLDSLKKEGLESWTSGFNDGSVKDMDSTGKVLAKGKMKFTKFFDTFNEITESPYIEFDPGLTFLPGGYIVSFHWQNLLRTEMI